MVGQVAQVFDLARRQPRGADLRRVERQHGRGQQAVRRSGRERDETVPDGLRRLHRDLLADDRAGQRREGIAAAFEPAVADARDELLHDPVALGQMLAGIVPEVGGGLHDRSLRAGWPRLQRPDPGRALRRILENDALPGEVVADASARAIVAARLGGARARRSGGRCSLRRGWRRPAGRRVAPAAGCPASRRAPCSSAASADFRMRFTSAASSNSTATAIGVLKSSFIAARKRGGARLVPVERRVGVRRSRPCRARCRGGAARSSRRRGWRR